MWLHLQSCQSHDFVFSKRENTDFLTKLFPSQVELKEMNSFQLKSWILCLLLHRFCSNHGSNCVVKKKRLPDELSAIAQVVISRIFLKIYEDFVSGSNTGIEIFTVAHYTIYYCYAGSLAILLLCKKPNNKFDVFWYIKFNFLIWYFHMQFSFLVDVCCLHRRMANFPTTDIYWSQLEEQFTIVIRFSIANNFHKSLMLLSYFIPILQVPQMKPSNLWKLCFPCCKSSVKLMSWGHTLQRQFSWMFHRMQ